MTEKVPVFQRKLFSRRDGLILLFLLALCALGFLFLSRLPQGDTAVVEQNGKTLLRRELSRLDGPEEVTVTGENGLSLTVVFSPDGAQVVSADCPDQVCVRTGKLAQAGETAVCLPARIALRLEGVSGTDAETY